MKAYQLVFIPALILFTISGSIKAQVPELLKNKEFQQDAQAAIHSIYNFKFKKGEQQLAPWKKKYPHDPIWQLIKGEEMWWHIISDLHDTSHDEEFIKKMKLADYAASQVLYKQPGNTDALLVRAAANGLIARLYSDRDEWIKSLRAVHKAYKIYGVLKKNINKDFPDLRLIEGLKLYYSAYLPKAYSVVRAMAAFLPKGNEEKGLKYLQEASKTAIFARAEATYFLGDIYYNYEHEYQKAVHYFKKLYQTYPRNNYYTRLLVRSEYKMERYDEALDIINASLKRWKNKDLPYPKILKENLLFWKGRILYHNKKYDQALPLFKQSLQLSEKLPRTEYRPFYVEAAFYTGMILNKQDNNQKAAHYFKLVTQAKTAKDFQKKARDKLAELE